MKRTVTVGACFLLACGHSVSAPPPEPAAVASSAAVAAAPAQSVAPNPEPQEVAAIEPPYDLVADLAERKAAIQKESSKARFEVVEDVFLLTAPSGVMGSSAVVAKKALEAYYNRRFDKKPARAITVLLYDTAPPYDAWCKAHTGKPCFTPFGFYEASIRTVVMNAGPGIGTLTHELVHPIVEADFPDAPDWINEGIASLYEAFSLPKKGEIRGNKNWRHPRLLKALQSKSERAHASLPALFAMSDKEFRGAREDLNYALARYFCQWMDTQNKLWPFYRAWRDDPSKGATRAFVSVMGKTPSELDEAWASWVKAL